MTHRFYRFMPSWLRPSVDGVLLDVDRVVARLDAMASHHEKAATRAAQKEIEARLERAHHQSQLARALNIKDVISGLGV